MRALKAIFAAILCALVVAGTPLAADLRIGVLSEPAVDPHFLYLSTNIAFSRHMFSPLVDRDDKAQPIPGLATSWTLIDPTTWEFKLRRGVKFHDGSDFTAEDVAFTLKRVPSLPANPSPYTTNMRLVTGTEIVDPHTIRIKTSEPDPVLASTLGNIFIVSAKAAANATVADFKSGKATIGTGPYKFVSFTNGDRLVLERFPNYFGARPLWDRVTFRVIANDSSRVSALLAGDVDLIDFVPPGDIVRLEREPKLRLYKGPSDRVIFLAPDAARDASPFVLGKDGRVLAPNPLKDVRVRLALSKAVNRNALIEKTMDNVAAPASQLVPEGFLGFSPKLKVEAYDPAGAKRLLAEAGFPDGFTMTIHGPNDRYVNDDKIIQTVAQMWSQIGIQMKVVALPKSVYFGKGKPPNGEYSMSLIGWGSATTGESTAGLAALIHSFDAKKNFGAWNYGNYANPKVDQIIQTAVTTLERGKRGELLQTAMEAAMADVAAIPLHVQFVVLAGRRDIVYLPRVDEQTVAMNARLAP